MPDASRRAAPLNHAATLWSPAPDFSTAAIDRNGWTVRPVSGLAQMLVSGDLAAARAAFAPDTAEVGLWEIAAPRSCLVRIARDRALVVSAGGSQSVASGWRSEGFAASDASDLYAVFDLHGPAIRTVVAEACAADLDAASPSAATLFAGFHALLYRTAENGARLHVEAPFAPALWRWLEERGG